MLGKKPFFTHDTQSCNNKYQLLQLHTHTLEEEQRTYIIRVSTSAYTYVYTFGSLWNAISELIESDSGHLQRPRLERVSSVHVQRGTWPEEQSTCLCVDLVHHMYVFLSAWHYIYVVSMRHTCMNCQREKSRNQQR